MIRHLNTLLFEFGHSFLEFRLVALDGVQDLVRGAQERWHDLPERVRLQHAEDALFRLLRALVPGGALQLLEPPEHVRDEVVEVLALEAMVLQHLLEDRDVHLLRDFGVQVRSLRDLLGDALPQFVVQFQDPIVVLVDEGLLQEIIEGAKVIVANLLVQPFHAFFTSGRFFLQR